MSDSDEKLESIKVVMAGAASGVTRAYVANVISKGVAAVPLLNMFNSKVSAVLTGVIVTVVPLGQSTCARKQGPFYIQGRRRLNFGGARAPEKVCFSSTSGSSRK
jgi:hypothetical protein